MSSVTAWLQAGDTQGVPKHFKQKVSQKIPRRGCPKTNQAKGVPNIPITGFLNIIQAQGASIQSMQAKGVPIQSNTGNLDFTDHSNEGILKYVQ